MQAEILRGSKEQIIERLAALGGRIVQVIVLLEEIETTGEQPIEEDMFAEMEPYMAQAGGADYSRESLYEPLPSEYEDDQ